MTKTRASILKVLKEAEVPLSTSEVHRRLDKRPNLATVYRALGDFEKQGLIESFSFTCSAEGTERYYHLHRIPHVHYFHCSTCHQFISLGTCGLSELESELESSYGVTIEDHTLYFTGICASCSPRPGQAADTAHPEHHGLP